MICLTLVAGALGCGRKGNPNPRPRAAPGVCGVRWSNLRILEVSLPSQDVRGEDLVGVEQVRVYFLPLGVSRPTPSEVISRGEVLLEKRRPDLPDPGQKLLLDMKEISRPAGWITVVSVRLGNVVGVPSEVLVWLDPAI
jgi:hypothetical protein